MTSNKKWLASSSELHYLESTFHDAVVGWLNGFVDSRRIAQKNLLVLRTPLDSARSRKREPAPVGVMPVLIRQLLTTHVHGCSDLDRSNDELTPASA